MTCPNCGCDVVTGALPVESGHGRMAFPEDAAMREYDTRIAELDSPVRQREIAELNRMVKL